VSFFVLDQEKAKDFYVNKLGFEIRKNVQIPGQGTWLLVAPKGQNIEITLIPVTFEMMFKKDTAQKLEELIKAKAFGYGVFECKDIFATCEELKSKGVVFLKEPIPGSMEPQAIFQDDSGNFLGLCQASK